MAAYCTFLLNDKAMSTFTLKTNVKGWLNHWQRFPAFSGAPDHRNKVDSAHLTDKGPVPLGLYYIVDRNCGGTLSCIYSSLSGRNRWFALYRDDGWVDDRTWYLGVQRGEFRIHPGPGTSRGCITIANRSNFDTLRGSLEFELPMRIPGVAGLAYGTVLVWRYGETSGPPRVPPELKMR